jgi:hypothetical protein
MDDDKAAAAADTLELLMMNQIAIRAALEELSLWISQRGSTHIHTNVLTALQTLDTNAQSIGRGLLDSARNRAENSHKNAIELQLAPLHSQLLEKLDERYRIELEQNLTTRFIPPAVKQDRATSVNNAIYPRDNTKPEITATI